MKKIILYSLAIVLASLWGCKKEEKLNVDMNSYNVDAPAQNDVDNWLSAQITNPYNIEVVYRFDRNLTDVAKDIAPVDYSKVQPMMEAVLNCYLKPYEKVAGKAFIKTLCPKQYVLYGSLSYNTNGSVTLGTADGGRKVTLYNVNNFQGNQNPEGVRRTQRTIHHEFTHILNQNAIIPPEFQEVTGADYTEDWTNSVNSETLAKQLGFVSRYARAKYTEDFAEVTAHLLVEGQIWFDNYVISSPIAAQAKLRRKEELVVQYFKDAFGIDFRVLQAEIQNSLKTNYNVADPTDLTQTFQAYLASNKVSTLTYTPTATHYTTYGNSTSFVNMWNSYVTAVSTQTASTKYIPRTLQLIFTSATTVTLRVSFTSTTSTTVFNADYNFAMNVVPGNGEMVFSKILPEGVGTTYNNGQIASMKPYFEQYLLPYFTNRVFVASWLPVGITQTDPLYRTFAGFTDKGASTNYFYGPIVLK